MDDWRKDLTEDELREVEAEDTVYRKQRKRAQDAMRMACKRAGPAMPKWLTKQDKAKMLEYYIAAQRLSWVHREKYQVDHIVPIYGCYYDDNSGCNMHYVCGLHVPDNLRVILARHNRGRADQLYTKHPPIPDDHDIPF